MKNEVSRLNLVQLRKALQQASLPADRQIARLKGYDVAFEVADDFGNWCQWVLDCGDVELTTAQRSSLAAMNGLLDKMSGERNARLWTDDALRLRPEWEEVRRRAREILDLFGWASEDSETG